MADTAVANASMLTKIAAMKAGTKPNASGGVPTGENGIAYVRAKDAFEGSKNVLIELYPYKGDKEPMKTLGYYVMTMYPKDPTGAPPA